MRNLKRALSVALASVMLLGMMVVGTGASSYSDVADNNDYIEAIEVLKAVGVMGGDDQGKFNPDASVTRAEMAVIMTNMLGLNPDDYAGTNPFTDVPDWAANYVAACYANDIVGGVGDNKFDPNGKITAVQAALMMQKALGYFQYASDYGTDWSETMVKVTKLASQIAMWKNVAGVTVNTELTRGQVAQVALNALKATTVDAKLISGGIQIGDITINENVEYNKVTNADADYKALGSSEKVNGEYTVELGEKLFECKLSVNTDSTNTDDFGAPATIWSYKGDEVGKFSNTDAALSYTADFDADEVEDLKDDDYDFSSAKVYVNGAKDILADVDAVAAEDFKGVTVDLYTDADDAKKVTNIVVRVGQFAKVTDVDDESITLKVSGETEVTFEDDSKKSDDTYDVLSGKYEKDDTLIVYFAGDATEKVLATADTTSFEGEVATVKGDEYFTVDGDKYNYSSVYASEVVKAGGEYTFIQDENGYVVAAEVIEEGATAISDVYYVDNVWEEVSMVSGAQVKSYYAQLVSLDGTVSEVELEKNYEAQEGALVTISDKKYTEDGTTYKADNGKYDLKAWSDADNWTVTDDAIAESKEFTKTATRIEGKKGTIRLNSSTEYLFVEGTANKLETTVYTGGVNFTVKAGDSVTVITKEGSSVASYVIVYTDKADQDAVYSEDVVFVAKVSSEQGDGYYAQEVYYADGTKETIKVDAGEYPALETGFYTYDTNSDGYYTFGQPEDMNIAKNFVWKDEEGVIASAEMGELYENLLTVKVGEFTVSDIETEGAKFVDVHSKTADGNYDKSVSSLSALAKLLEDEKASKATLALNVSEDGAVIIFVTDIDA